MTNVQQNYFTLGHIITLCINQIGLSLPPEKTPASIFSPFLPKIGVKNQLCLNKKFFKDLKKYFKTKLFKFNILKMF